eukprot:2630736-Prymnesium_polylepis.2
MLTFPTVFPEVLSVLGDVARHVNWGLTVEDVSHARWCSQPWPHSILLLDEWCDGVLYRVWRKVAPAMAAGHRVVVILQETTAHSRADYHSSMGAVALASFPAGSIALGQGWVKDTSARRQSSHSLL